MGTFTPELTFGPYQSGIWDEPPAYRTIRYNGWTPADLFAGGYQGVFFDINDRATLWADTGATTPAVLNGGIARVNDKSGNGNNLLQGTGGSQPLLKQTSGRGRALFDGVADFLATSAVDLSASDEVTVMLSLAKSSDVATQVVAENTTAAGSFRLYVPAGGTGYTHGMTGTLSSDSTATGFPAIDVSVVTGLGKISTDTNIIRVDGVQRASTATDQGAGNMGNYAIYLGMREGSAFPFTGSVYSFFVINRLLTADELTLLETWATL